MKITNSKYMQELLCVMKTSIERCFLEVMYAPVIPFKTLNDLYQYFYPYHAEIIDTINVFHKDKDYFYQLFLRTCALSIKKKKEENRRLDNIT